METGVREWCYTTTTSSAQSTTILYCPIDLLEHRGDLLEPSPGTELHGQVEGLSSNQREEHLLEEKDRELSHLFAAIERGDVKVYDEGNRRRVRK